MKRMRLLSVGYLVVQWLSVVGWWVVLWLVPGLRSSFVAEGLPFETLSMCAVVDIGLLGFGSLVAAYGLARRRGWMYPVLCVVAGAGCYASIFTLTVALRTGDAWLGAAMMLPCLFIMPWLVWRWHGEGAADETGT